MVMSRIWTGVLFLSLVAAWITGAGQQLGTAVLEGAQAGITLSISMAGTLCLWSGVGKLMEAAGITEVLSRFLRPLLQRIFPSARNNSALRRHLSSNVCANLLGLGNAATPMGIAAVRQMKDPTRPERATDEMCRLIVLNTASIQLLPASVAALRSTLGCASPFDILPAVWVTSLCSAGLGLAVAALLGKLVNHD